MKSKYKNSRFGWIGNIPRYEIQSNSDYTQWHMRCSSFDSYVRALKFRSKTIKEVNGNFTNKLKLKSLLSTLYLPNNNEELYQFLSKPIDRAYYILIGTKKVWDKEITFEEYIKGLRNKEYLKPLNK